VGCAPLDLVVDDTQVEGVEHESFGGGVGVAQALAQVG
jgi:hypothetical protein